MISPAPSTCFHSCSFLMRSAMMPPRAAFAAARLLCAIEDFSLTSTICSFFANSSIVLFGFLELDFELSDLVLEKDLGRGVGLKALVEIGGDVGVCVGVGDALRARWIGVGVVHIDEA